MPLSPTARRLLAELNGHTVRTITGRPNRILGMREDSVMVGTGRSPRTSLWVQRALDRLQADGTVEVTTDALEHRSAFVAVSFSPPGCGSHRRCTAADLVE